MIDWISIPLMIPLPNPLLVLAWWSMGLVSHFGEIGVRAVVPGLGSRWKAQLDAVLLATLLAGPFVLPLRLAFALARRWA